MEKTYTAKTSPGDFKITTLENPLLSKLVFNPCNAQDHFMMVK